MVGRGARLRPGVAEPHRGSAEVGNVALSNVVEDFDAFSEVQVLRCQHLTVGKGVLPVQIVCCYLREIEVLFCFLCDFLGVSSPLYTM